MNPWGRVSTVNMPERSVRHPWLETRVESKHPLGDQMQALRKGEQARRFYERALDISEALVKAEPGRYGAWEALGVTHGNMAEVLRLLGDAEGEREHSLRCAEAAGRAAALYPDDNSVQYNLACALSRTHQADAALRALSRSVELGHRDAAWTAQDPDFALLREDPRFQALLERMRALETADVER